jgi:hypothetical protein
VLFTTEDQQRSGESSFPEQQGQQISLYQCDMRWTTWTLHCVSQADIILIIGLAGRGFDVHQVMLCGIIINQNFIVTFD